jgi:hypothetical protein
MKKPITKIEMTPEKAAAIAKYHADTGAGAEEMKKQFVAECRAAILAKIPHSLRHLLPKSIG